MKITVKSVEVRTIIEIRIGGDKVYLKRKNINRLQIFSDEFLVQILSAKVTDCQENI